MHLVCGGINHNTSTLEQREKFQLTRSELPQAVNDYRDIEGVREIVIVPTCNRIEYYQITDKKKDIRRLLFEFYKSRGAINEFKDLNDFLFVRQETSAARHLFKVASGLDSMLFGEYQILSQVKDAYSAACSIDGAGKILHKLFHQAFNISKRIRTETEIGKGTQGLGGAALDIIKDIYDIDVKETCIGIIGVNGTTEILLRKLSGENPKTYLFNRTYSKAEKLARFYNNVTPKTLDELRNLMSEIDILITFTASDGFIVDKNIFSEFDQKQRIIIDLAVPRDVDPDITHLTNNVLLDLDDIKQYLEKQAFEKSIEMPYALDLVEEQVRKFEQWRKTIQSNNHAELRAILDEDRSEVLNRFRNNFKQGDQKALEAFSKSLYKQFVRRITTKPVSSGLDDS